MLSYRGSERQPNMLQLSLRSSLAMEERANQGLHPKDWPAEVRLRKIMEEFHQTKGMLSKWMVDEDCFQSCLNLICGTTPESRSVIRAARSCAEASGWPQADFDGGCSVSEDVLGIGHYPVCFEDPEAENEPEGKSSSLQFWLGQVREFCMCLQICHAWSLFVYLGGCALLKARESFWWWASLLWPNDFFW